MRIVAEFRQLFSFNFVIVKAFYPLLLTVSRKFGVHFQPFTKGCRTLLGRLYLFTSYALHCLSAFSLSDKLARY
nr:MAG TPA: hypothetical protein [Caudoviricetes sp.]